MTAKNTSASRSFWRVAFRRLEGRLLLTAFAVAGALWAFLSITDGVSEHETARFDRAILLAFRVPGHSETPIGPRWVQESARDVTALGGFTVLTLVSLVAIALLLIHKRRLLALIFGITVTATQVAAEVVKHIVNRPRPDLVTHHDLVYSASFPSGHATMAPVVYLTLAVIVSAGEAQRSARILIFTCAVLTVTGVGLSRVYLGVHWPTDVLAGWGLGAVIALSAMTVLYQTAERTDPGGDSPDVVERDAAA